jgi:hypothetical protein
LLKLERGICYGLGLTLYFPELLVFLFVMLLWQLETFKRTLMQSLQEDDENPTVSYPSFSAPEHTVLICVLILEAKYHICGFQGEGGDKRGVANSNLAIRRASRKLLLHQSKFRKELYSFCSINDLKCWRGVHFVRKTKLYHDAQSFESSAP